MLLSIGYPTTKLLLIQADPLKPITKSTFKSKEWKLPVSDSFGVFQVFFYWQPSLLESEGEKDKTVLLYLNIKSYEEFYTFHVFTLLIHIQFLSRRDSFWTIDFWASKSKSQSRKKTNIYGLLHFVVHVNTRQSRCSHAKRPGHILILVSFPWNSIWKKGKERY